MAEHFEKMHGAVRASLGSALHDVTARAPLSFCFVSRKEKRRVAWQEGGTGAWHRCVAPLRGGFGWSQYGPQQEAIIKPWEIEELQ